MIRVILRSVFSHQAHVGGPSQVELKTIDMAAPEVEAFLSEPARMNDHDTTRDVLGLEVLSTPSVPEEPPAPASVPVPDPPIVIVRDPPVVTPPDVDGKRVLTAADFYYKRSVQVPVGLGNSRGEMGVRNVNGRRQAIMLGSKNATAAIEFDLDTGETIRTILDWHGKAMFIDDPEGMKGIQPFGACIDEAQQQLIWTFADSYNVKQRADPSFGVTALGSLRTDGPFFAPPSSHRTAGYPVILPGNVLAFGAGFMSGIGACSPGPCLYGLDGTPILKYEWDKRCRRNADYLPVLVSESPDSPDLPPDAGEGPLRGHWTQHDTVAGCCAIDLPDRHGLVFGGFQAQGRVWYGDNDALGVHDKDVTHGPHAERRVPMLWLYDLFNPQPDQFEEIPLTGDLMGLLPPAFGYFPRITGMWCDKAHRELVCVAPLADYTGDRVFAPTPLVHLLGIR